MAQQALLDAENIKAVYLKALKRVRYSEHVTSYPGQLTHNGFEQIADSMGPETSSEHVGGISSAAVVRGPATS